MDILEYAETRFRPSYEPLWTLTETQKAELLRAEKRGYLLAMETEDTVFSREPLIVHRLDHDVSFSQVAAIGYPWPASSPDSFDEVMLARIHERHPCSREETIGEPLHLAVWEGYRKFRMCRPAVTVGAFTSNHINCIQGGWGCIGLKVDGNPEDSELWSFYNGEWAPLLRFLAPLTSNTYHEWIFFNGMCLHMHIDVADAESLAATVVDLIEDLVKVEAEVKA